MTLPAAPVAAPPGTDRPAYRSSLPAAGDGLLRLVHAEWTKLRTVPSWFGSLVGAGVVTVVLGLLPVQVGGDGCEPAAGPDPGTGASGEADEARASGGSACTAPRGPGGTAVADSFSFVHRPLRGDGSITVRVASLTGQVPAGDLTEAERQEPRGTVPGVVPWAKAGLLVKDGTDQGAAYAAVMVTGEHGVRMQHDFVHDVAGDPAADAGRAPHWLRLRRQGDTITGYESVDGSAWREVGRARLSDLPATAEVGLFVASPQATHTEQRPFQLIEAGGPSQATGVFDRVELDGWSSGGGTAAERWERSVIGDDPVAAPLADFEESGGTFTIRGSGDVGPSPAGPTRLEQSLVGTFVGLILVLGVATVSVTGEHRRGLAATTYTASPRRRRVLVAKAVVAGTAAFVVGLLAALVAVTAGARLASANGRPWPPVDAATGARVVVGTALLLALAAVLSVAMGTLLRRSAGALAAVVALTVLPYMLATASVLPTGPSDWLLRLTPAAAFAVQQTAVEHHQITALYAPANGFFPLAPLVGLAVLGLYAAGAVALAAATLPDRDR